MNLLGDFPPNDVFLASVSDVSRPASSFLLEGASFCFPAVSCSSVSALRPCFACWPAGSDVSPSRVRLRMADAGLLKAAHAASENRVGRTLPSATRAPALGVGLRAAPKLSHSAAHVVGVGFSGRFGEAAEPAPPSRLNDKSSSQHMEEMFRKISSRVQGLGGVKAGSRAQEHEDRMRDLSRNIQDLSLRMKFNPP